MNFLEQLAAEWYEFNGYFVRTNVLVGKRDRGGYECELDVLAFHPVTRHLVHLEASTDAGPWEKREERFRKKFEAGRKHIPSIFSGLNIPHDIEQIALMGYGKNKTRDAVAGAKLLTVGDLLGKILTELRGRPFGKAAVPEDKVLLRLLQYVCENRRTLVPLLTDS